MTRTELLKTAKPILFNTEMVKAILDGRKTVTRRVVKTKAVNLYRSVGGLSGYFKDKPLGDQANLIKPTYNKGDILYVREAWYYENHMHDLTAGEPDLPNGEYSHRYVYRASSPDYPVDKWRPSIHMPKSAARIFLKVTDVRVERLQDINEYGAEEEGVEGVETEWLPTYIDNFIRLWNSTIKKQDLDKYGWNANPWVWVYEFERVENNDTD